MKRINMTLRFDAEVHRLLYNKRHQERTTFQEIGHRLFMEWLKSTPTAQPKKERT